MRKFKKGTKIFWTEGGFNVFATAIGGDLCKAESEIFGPLGDNADLTMINPDAKKLAGWKVEVAKANGFYNYK